MGENIYSCVCARVWGRGALVYTKLTQRARASGRENEDKINYYRKAVGKTRGNVDKGIQIAAPTAPTKGGRGKDVAGGRWKETGGRGRRQAKRLLNVPRHLVIWLFKLRRPTALFWAWALSYRPHTTCKTRKTNERTSTL